MDRQFLLMFDRDTGGLIVDDLGTEQDAAVAAYEAAERAHRRDERLEIVLIGAASLDDIRVTHPHYFNNERGTDSLTQLEEQVREERSAS